MAIQYYNDNDGGVFAIASFQNDPTFETLQIEKLFKIIWCAAGRQELAIDGKDLALEKDQLLFCTPENILELPENHLELKGYFFNHDFYRKQNQYHNVTDGVLFYGLENAPIIELTTHELNIMDAIHVLIQEEFQQKDVIHGELLQALLKRILTTTTRLLQINQRQDLWSQKQVNLVKEFNLLVELHFKEKHQVADYAELLSKSPKTLSNLFKKYEVASPLKIINERILLEAQRLLRFSDLTAEEIGQELGYNEPSHFSKFFRKQTGTSPLSYRKHA